MWYNKLHINKREEVDKMNNRDWERLGEDILKTVQDAVESCNYDRLNQTVGDAVNQVVDGVAKNVKNMRESANQRKAAQQTVYSQPNYQRPPYQPQKMAAYIKMPSKALGIILSIFGFVPMFILLLVEILIVFAAVVTGGLFKGFWAAIISILIACGACASVGIVGTSMTNRIERFKRYLKEIGSAEFCNISDMANRIRKPASYVVKDVERMIRKGWFVQGHFDNQKTCLILTDQMYQQYKQLEDQRAKQQKEAEERQQKTNALSPEVQKVIAKGDAFVKKIRECNDAIPGEEISAKIYRMETIVDKIFDRVEKNPVLVGDIRKLMEYYLPTTVKLLEAYAQMDAQPVGGENIQTAKKEIEATLDTLNVAFENLLDSLFQDAAWDVSSDISVLNTMLAQEGLKNDGLRSK